MTDVSEEKAVGVKKKPMTFKRLKVLRDRMLVDRFGYLPTSNPFGDPNLSEPFIWKKKNELLKASTGRNAGLTTAEDFLKQTESKIVEIESVKKRREERELEEKLLEEQRAILSRERELENYDEWVAREDSFHREMAQRRTDVRIRQGRERPSDLLAKSLRLAAGEVFDDLTLLDRPIDVLVKGFDLEELREFIKEVNIHVDVCTSAAKSRSRDLLEEEDRNQSKNSGINSNSDDEYDSSSGIAGWAKLNDDFKGLSKKMLATHVTYWNSVCLIAMEALRQKLQEVSSSDSVNSSANKSNISKIISSLSTPAPNETPFPGDQRHSNLLGVASDDHKSSNKRDVESGLPFSVIAEIDSFLSSKSREELADLKVELVNKVNKISSSNRGGGNDDDDDEDDDGGSNQDVSYWECIIEKLPYSMAVAECRHIFNVSLAKVEEIKKEFNRSNIDKSNYMYTHDGNEEAEDDVDESRAHRHSSVCLSPLLEPFDGEVRDGVPSPSFKRLRETAVGRGGEREGDENERYGGARERENGDDEYHSDADEESGRKRRRSTPSDLSPPSSQSPFFPLLQPTSRFRSIADTLLDPHDYLESRERLRRTLVEERRALIREREKMRLKEEERKLGNNDEQEKAGVSPFDKFIRDESNQLASDELAMSKAFELTLPKHTFDWEDKYRPRKPRFFNRVKTGYEWSKYNQSHYDHDNPPPKAVQGYKFNLFYPDLIDKTKSPTWVLLASDNPDTAIIRFHAGPPYEDVAFKIINREWDINFRKGYKSSFDRGILQLYFNFKRFRYRR